MLTVRLSFKVMKRIKRLTIFLSVPILCIAVGEIAVRFWAPQELISDVIEFDQVLCHRLKSNVRGVQNSPEFSVQIITNSLGMRDRNYAAQKKKNTFRILMLGDSHTLGWGVKLEDSFTKILERSLNENSDDFSYEVINCGMYGYGTAHQYQFLKKIGYTLHPDMVIVAMDFLHDIKVNNQGYFHFEGKSFIRSTKLCFAQKSRSVTQYVPFSSFLRGHSHLFRYVGVKLQRLHAHLFRKAKNTTTISSGEEIYSSDNTRRIFRKLKKELQARGIDLRVIILPEFDSMHQKPRSNLFFLPLLASFKEFLSREEIDYLSLQDRFERYSSFSEFTFKYSHHFTPKGHQFIAKQIEKLLRGKVVGTIKNGT